MNNLIINGIDHSKFDIPWAKRGGVVMLKKHLSKVTYVCNISGTLHVAQTLGQKVFNGESFANVSPRLLRMATPDECAEAGIEYIEPPARWLPIESAPKDGSRILIKKYGTVFVAGWGYVVDDIYGWVIVNDCYLEHSDNLLWMDLHRINLSEG